MKKKELINIIERLVRKEVKKQVNEIFISEGKKALANRSIQNDEVSSSLTQLAEQEYVQPKPKKKEFKEYTKNSALNKVLNETVGGIPQGDKGAYPTMGGGAYTSDRVSGCVIATSKGYPPSVVSLIPKLIERSGTGKENEGSITAFYTVLADGDDNNDPVVDAARAILDGHIVLSRQQSLMGIYPAIDVPNSISRVMNEITDEKQQTAAKEFKKNISIYLENRDLILMGGYSSGQDENLDRAISLWPELVNHISQKDSTGSTYNESKNSLITLLGQ